MTSGCTKRCGNPPLDFPLLRRAAERGLVAAVALSAMLSTALADTGAAPAAEAEHGMVVSAHRLASEAGVRILQDGGNAIDAAVAVGYALAVVDPCCGNLGGGGFMTLRLADGREAFIDFREKAPLAATPAMYLDAAGHVKKGGISWAHLGGVVLRRMIGRK